MPAVRVRLTRLSGGSHYHMAEPRVGNATSLPVVGESFVITAPDDESWGWLRTSTVSEALHQGQFKTRSGSVYQLEVL